MVLGLAKSQFFYNEKCHSAKSAVSCGLARIVMRTLYHQRKESPPSQWNPVFTVLQGGGRGVSNLTLKAWHFLNLEILFQVIYGGVLHQLVLIIFSPLELDSHLQAEE